MFAEATKFITGFKFKPTHTDIHFLLADKNSDDYIGTFSTDLTKAARFSSQAEATKAIYKELSSFSQDDDYEWTPVLCNEKGEEIGNIRPFFKVGTKQFEDQDLPHFLNLTDSENVALQIPFEKKTKAVSFVFEASTFVIPGAETAPGEWSDATLCDIQRLRGFYPELSHWGNLAIGGAFGDFSRDFLEVSWADWMLKDRNDYFLCYCCLMQINGEWIFHCDDETLLSFNQWRT